MHAFLGLLRSVPMAPKRWRLAAETEMDTPLRITQNRKSRRRTASSVGPLDPISS